MTFFRDYKIVTFYTSYKEAIEQMCKSYYDYFVEEPRIVGLIEQLSKTPDLLKTIINMEENIRYKNNIITFERNRKDMLFLINDLLIEKPIFVEQKSLEEIENKIS